jgi:DNA-binding LytR/AlgR family response regulator
MERYRIAIVEDNPDDQQAVLDLVSRVPFLTVVGTFADALTALPMLTNEPVDLLLLDLHLPGLSGFELLRSLVRPPAVILTTSSLGGPLEAFDLGVADYLLKPLRYERFLRAVNRAVLRPAPQPPALARPLAVTLRQGFESVRIMPDQIMLLEAVGAYTNVHLTNGEIIQVSHLLTGVLARLPADAFVRVHRSYAVAVGRISRFSREQLTVGTRQLRVGRAYQDALLRLLNDGHEP